MVFLILVGVLFAGYGTAYVASDDVRYLTRAGFEETRILEARRPIAEVVRDPGTPPALRHELRLVLDSRDYAAQLGLNARQTYTTFADVGRDTLLLNLSAAPKDCICPYTWKYPIVGRIPYKGFFDVEAAKREADRLAARGYDVYLRPAAAFSTLGWFNDPLLSTAIGPDTVELAALVFHEIAHNSLYVKSATPFNESFAQLVGYRGAESFFRSRGDSGAARHAADRWHDEIVLGAYYDSLVARLNAFYATHPDSAALDSGRAAAAQWAREQLEGPVGAQLRTYRIGRLAERPINNARLVGALIYRTRLDLFERWYERHDRDIARSVAALKTLMAGAEGDSAFARLEHAAAEQGTGAGPP
ncbi:MAG TPA: aminopeptidase [Gemmatimonadales bacterium]|jgi:predicted aminopeptidase|nr:aminopeptidase [Gemmatimonadales bacterium]